MQSGTQQAFVTRESAFGLPALAILAAVKTPLHLPPILGLGPLAALAAAVDGDDGRANSQFLAAEAVVGFTIKGGVAQDPVPGNEQRGLLHGGSKLGRIVAGPGADGGRSQEMAAGVTDDRQLGPRAGRVLFAGAGEEIAGSVLAIQARGIDGRFGPLIDQAAVLGAHGGHDEEENGLPFFKSRGKALQSVE